MNKTTAALKLADKVISRYRNETPIGNQPHMICHIADDALAAIREVLAEQDHFAASGKMVAEPLQILPGGGAFPFVEVGYVGEFVAPTKSLPAGTPLCVAPAQPVKQEHSEQYWLHEINNARAEGYEKGRASCKHDERMLELGVPVQPVKQEPVMDYEHICALREGEQHQAEDSYFFVRPENDTPTSRKMFCQGFERGFHKGLKYAAPVSAKREWVELTDDELEAIQKKAYENTKGTATRWCFAHAAIAAFKEKNK